MNFKVEKGGEKPSIPRDKVKFRINGIGDYDWFDPLPESLTAHLTDGTNPIYEYDGKKALLEVGYFNNKKIIEKVYSQPFFRFPVTLATTTLKTGGCNNQPLS